MNINLNGQESESQCKKIRRALENGERITPIDALEKFGCFRLGARIWDLVHTQGMDIKKEWYTTPTGKKVMSYRMA